ncbi:serine hydrolase [Candidatus Gottesmanbacteria bacterium]|nr:serine hydrolase [Candidatus Gottesmanbacteria bacterium]
MGDYAVSYTPRSLDRDPPNFLEKSKKKKTIIVFALFLAFIYFLYRSGFLENLNVLNIGNKEAKKDKLIADLQKIISSSGGTFSIYIYDINAKEGFGINERMVIRGASLNKIPILASLYTMVNQGKIDLEKQIVIQKEDMQDYGTGSIRYDKPGTLYSLKTLARLMMEKSDNTASHLLGKVIIGEDKVQEMINKWNLTQTDMAENKTSAYDLEIIMTKIYNGEITNQALSAEMLDFMYQTDFEDRITLGVPKEIKVYHKTGDEVGKIHDVAIVDLPGRPYYLAVLTTDMADEKKTKEAIAKISELVYAYMK